MVLKIHLIDRDTWLWRIAISCTTPSAVSAEISEGSRCRVSFSTGGALHGMSFISEHRVEQEEGQLTDLSKLQPGADIFSGCSFPWHLNRVKGPIVNTSKGVLG